MLHFTPASLAETLGPDPADLSAPDVLPDLSAPGTSPDPAYGPREDSPGIVFAGTPEIAATCLRTLLARNAPIVAVLTRPDAPVGRRRTRMPSPVAAAAAEAGLPVIKADRVDAETQRALTAVGASLGVVVAYGALLPEAALSIPERGWVNLHYSRLPRYRGAAPVQHALLHGETTTAATVFQLERGMDTGPVHGLCDYAIPAGRSAGDVLQDLTAIGTDLITVLLPDLLRGTSQPEPQSGTPSSAPKLGRHDAFIDFGVDASAVSARINATLPEPGAWTLHGEQRIKLGPARPLKVQNGPGDSGRDIAGEGHGRAGEVLPADDVALVPDAAGSPGNTERSSTEPDSTEAGSTEAGSTEPTRDEVVVLASRDAVAIATVQPAGKKPMAAADWLRGQQGTVRFSAQADAASPARTHHRAPETGGTS